MANNLSIFKFAAVGVCNTAIDLGAYLVLTRSFGFFDVHIFFAKTISFILATIFSFTANKYWTFGHEGSVKVRELAKFYLTAGSAIFINLGSLYVFHLLLGFHDAIAILIAAGLSFLWNYGFSRFWVFKKPESNDNPDRKI